MSGDDRRGDLLHEGRGSRGNDRREIKLACDARRHDYLVQVLERGVNRFVVLLHDCVAAIAVALLDRVFDLLNRFIARQHTAYGEEARLHDRVDSHAHTGLSCNIVAVDHVKLQLLADDCFLYRAR